MAAANDKLEKKIDDIQSYPVLTEEISFPALPRPIAGGLPGGAPLGQVVNAAIRDVLAWRPRSTDPDQFLLALNQAFELKEVEGHTEWSWKPRTYAVQHDMGALTGAQASIYARAKAALEQSLPLLDGLEALECCSDETDKEAARAIVRSALNEVVHELGEVGGPRVQRVDELFRSLLGPQSSESDPEKVGGSLGKLRDEFGLTRAEVNTIEEEQNLTNFIILVDHVNSLRRTWEQQRSFFDRLGRDVFLGTQLELLSRALAVVAESVHETYFVLDSLFVGPAERQTMQLNLGPGEPKMTVAELLGWVDRFVSEEAPRVMREGGKDGVISLQPTARKLRDLVETAWKIARTPAPNPTPGLHTPRSSRAFEELFTNLRELVKLFEQVKRFPRPEIVSISPDRALTGDRVRVTIDGANFRGPADQVQVRLNRAGPSRRAIHGTRITVVSEHQIDATFDLRGAEVGAYTVVVINPDQQHDELRGAFTVDARPVVPVRPTLAGVEPSAGRQDEEINVKLAGRDFKLGASADFGGGVVVKSVAFRSDVELLALIEIAPDAVLGLRDVTVSQDGESATLHDSFEVQPKTPPPPPVLKDVNPRSGTQGETKTVVLVGENFPTNAANAKLGFGAGVTPTIAKIEATRIEATITIEGGAPLGGRTVVVEDLTTGQKDEKPDGFSVTQKPIP